MKNKKIKIAIDIDDCVCNTWEADLNWAYVYAKENKIPNEIKNIPMEQYRNYRVGKMFKFSDLQEDEFFIAEKNTL